MNRCLHHLFWGLGQLRMISCLMPNLTAHITHLLERSEELCTLRFEHFDEQVIAQLSKKEATQQGYLYGFEDAARLVGLAAKQPYTPHQWAVLPHSQNGLRHWLKRAPRWQRQWLLACLVRRSWILILLAARLGRHWCQ